MTQRGMVYKTDGEDCSVVVFRKSACGEHCQSCGICGDTRVEIKAKNTCGASEGDVVRIESSSKRVLMVAFVVYMLPVILFFSGLAVFYALFDGRIEWSVLGGALGLFVAFIIAKWYNRLVKGAGGVNYEIFVDKA